MSEWKNEVETRYTRSEGGYVAYQTFGEGEVDLLLVSNWLQNLDVMWDEPRLARYLRRLGSFARVVAFDKRGSGISDPVTINSIPILEEWSDDARAAVDAAGIDTFAALGDTEGGPMAIMLAATFPERVSSLILVNSFARWRRDADYPIGMPDGVWKRLTDRYEDNWGVTSSILDLTAPSMADDRRFHEWYRKYQRLSQPRGSSAAMYKWVTNLDVRSVLPSIRVPTLVIGTAAARHHRAAFSRYLAENIPSARYVELPGSDTYPLQAGNFDAVLDEVETFLTGARSAPIVDRTLSTILFTDIVDSTGRVAKIGDAQWLALRHKHDDMVRAELSRFRGREVNHTGDGFLALFDGPARAVTCAARIAENAKRLGIETRAGLHTGEVELRDDQVGGLAVHLANRVMSHAEPGIVLVSSTVKDLVLGSGIDFTSRGPYELKGLPGTWPLFQLDRLP
jgi:class 3 adenylate cyclase